ncbi:MAG: trehalose 6-phosphate phosphatase [Actinomycetota bacterium]|jgi:trehalose 6-phosphate phosphatase|nr:trehalose 6-phosphate phosphatase [Actinomycetota bacterium]
MPLPDPATPQGREGLRALLADPGRALVGLDFDGTLAPIVAEPDAARAHPDIPPALRRLAGHLGRLAVVTGRPAALAVDYADLAGVPGLVVLGHYGLERWEDGALTTPGEHPGVEAARSRVPALLEDLGRPEGVHVEDKGRSVAVHVRRAPDPAGADALLRAPLLALADELGLLAEPGRMVLELRPPGGDKGDALRALVAQMTPPGPSSVVFVGDDLGDLPAFEAVEQLRAQGVAGLLVCSGSTEVHEVADRADLVVDGPEGVAAWLAAVADELT